MTIETEDYITNDLMKRGKEIRNRNGWVSLHTDFINNKESDGYHVTYVNGSDDFDNSAEAIQNRLDFQRDKELKEKWRDGTISVEEKDEITRKLLGI